VAGRGLTILAAVVLAHPAVAAASDRAAPDVPYLAMAVDREATVALRKGELDPSRPYLIVNDAAYAIPQGCWPRAFGGGDAGRAFGGSADGRAFGGNDTGRAFGGNDTGRAFGGDQAGRRMGGDDAGRAFGGNDTGRAFGGDANGRAFGGNEGGRAFGGDANGRAFGGNDTGRAFGGDANGRAFGGAESALGCRLMASGARVEFTPARRGVVHSAGATIDVRDGVLVF
jgi:hypothetical protein